MVPTVGDRQLEKMDTEKGDKNSNPLVDRENFNRTKNKNDELGWRDV